MAHGELDHRTVVAGIARVRSATSSRPSQRSSRKSNTVDLLSGGANANPKPSLANGVPTIYTSQSPTELIVFKGQPDFVPVVGTQLLWASNTTSDVLIDTTNNNYYALLAGPLVPRPGD